LSVSGPASWNAIPPRLRDPDLSLESSRQSAAQDWILCFLLIDVLIATRAIVTVPVKCCVSTFPIVIIIIITIIINMSKATVCLSPKHATLCGRGATSTDCWLKNTAIAFSQQISRSVCHFYLFLNFYGGQFNERLAFLAAYLW